MLSKRRANILVLLVQSIFTAMSGIALAYLAPVMQRFGYDSLQIGATMTAASLAAFVAQPVWGYLNDKFSCSKQIILASCGVSCALFYALVHSGGQRLVVTACIMGIYATIFCMMGFIDSWVSKLMAGGLAINYGATRSGGSVSYAVTVAIFGVVVERFGYTPAPVVLIVMFVFLCAVVLMLPNPPRVEVRRAVTLREGVLSLAANRVYLIFIGAYFLNTISSCATDSFFSVLVAEMGGSESVVGAGLFIMAITEVPIMAFYNRFKRHMGWSASRFIALSMIFYGLKGLGMGLAPTYGWVFASIALHGLSFALFLPASIDFMLETVEEKYLSTAQLLAWAVGSSLGSMAGNSIDGAIAKAYGAKHMMIAVSVCSFVAAAVIFLSNRRTARAKGSADV